MSPKKPAVHCPPTSSLVPSLSPPPSLNHNSHVRHLSNLHLTHPPGTAIIAQFGIILLAALIWASIFLHPPLSLFSYHPLLNSTAILILTQSILLLQPTHTPSQKRAGTLTHITLNLLAAAALISALSIILYNKNAHSAPHFTSAHGILGLTTYILLLLQALVGITQYFVPALYGGVDNAKAVYKYHRASGYVILGFLLATVIAATYTYTGAVTLGLRTWAVVLSAFLVVVGIMPRIHIQKLGMKSRREREREERERRAG
jgi:hypothetical protein